MPLSALRALELTLPPVATAVANYMPFVEVGGILYISGQLPFVDGKKTHVGRLGEDTTTAQGALAARNCALNILAQVNAAVGGDWGRVIRCIKLGGFVASAPTFTDQPAVINGASDFMVAILGERGRHARFAVGVPVLPFGAAVEVEAIFAVRG